MLELSWQQVALQALNTIQVLFLAWIAADVRSLRRRADHDDASIRRDQS
jgi:hypothetical protein